MALAVWNSTRNEQWYYSFSPIIRVVFVTNVRVLHNTTFYVIKPNTANVHVGILNNVVRKSPLYLNTGNTQRPIMAVGVDDGI